MTTIPEAAVKAAADDVYERTSLPLGRCRELAAYALAAALPHLTAAMLADLRAIEVTVELMEPSGPEESSGLRDLAAAQVAALIERLGDQPKP